MEGEPKIRVALGNDQWWDIMPVQTQAMRKQIKKSAQREATEQMRTESRPMARNTEVLDMLDLNSLVVDYTLVQMSVGWSWPEPINVKTIENREAWMIDAVLQRMNETYSRTPEQIKALEKNLPAPS